MVMQDTRTRAQLKATKWFGEEKKLQAQSAGARVKLNMIQAGDKVVGTTTAQIGVVVDRIESARGYSADQVTQAQDEVKRIDSELTKVSAKLNAARAAQRASDSVDSAKQGVADTVGDMKNKVKDAGKG